MCHVGQLHVGVGDAASMQHSRPHIQTAHQLVAISLLTCELDTAASAGRGFSNLARSYTITCISHSVSYKVTATIYVCGWNTWYFHLFCSGQAASQPPPALVISNKQQQQTSSGPGKQLQGLPRTDAGNNYFVLMKVRQVVLDSRQAAYLVVKHPGMLAMLQPVLFSKLPSDGCKSPASQSTCNSNPLPANCALVNGHESQQNVAIIMLQSRLHDTDASRPAVTSVSTRWTPATHSSQLSGGDQQQYLLLW